MPTCPFHEPPGARHTSRQLGKLLASDALSDEQRQTILGTLENRGRSARSPMLYSEFERQLIVDYRKMDQVTRTAVRLVFERCGAQRSKGGAR